jgi:hypothetical protein
MPVYVKGKIVPVHNKLNVIPWRHVRDWRYTYCILDNGIIRCELSALRPGRFTPGEESSEPTG